jgi:hypothetical protein|nr:MAG TPA: Protein of unknown function (DUF1642) [Caudoviricetes sp.]
MNKQELIKKYKRLEGVWDAEGAEIARRIFLLDLYQLDEPQKVVVPQFVADWIEECNAKRKSLLGALLYTPEGVNSWVGNSENQETFARAWLDGYEVEKEPKYTVRVKGVSGYCQYLNQLLSSKEYFFASINEIKGYRTKHTRKQLEEAGFGEVFNSPLFEVQEVE